VRAWLTLMVVAGCDLVYGLEGRLPPEKQPGDEDGDGALDNDDSCPHIASQSTTDADDDGISVDCDPDDSNPTTMKRWFPITAGSIDGLSLDGVGMILEDGYALGDPDHFGLSSLVFDVDTGTAIVDVGFEILSNSAETDGEQPWAEMGVMTVHRSFVPERERRGDVCFLGVSLDTDAEPPMVESAYLEMNEDEEAKPSVMFPAPLNGSVGVLHMERTRLDVACSVVRPGKTTANASFEVDTLAATTGKIAITSERMVTKLTFAWLAWQP